MISLLRVLCRPRTVVHLVAGSCVEKVLVGSMLALLAPPESPEPSWALPRCAAASPARCYATFTPSDGLYISWQQPIFLNAGQ